MTDYKVVYASNGSEIGHGLRTVRVDENGMAVNTKGFDYSPIVLKATTPAAPPAYELPAGMLRPLDIYIGWDSVTPRIIEPNWMGGAGTMGDPDLIEKHWLDSTVTLHGKYKGSAWHSGKLQLDRPKRGQGVWSWVTQAVNEPNAVCAMFTYADDGTELDFEYVKRDGTTGWQCNVWMPLEGGGRAMAKEPIFVPMPDISQPTEYQIVHDAYSTDFFIDGNFAGFIRPSDMPDGTIWKTDAKMSQFTTVEKHGSWAGWTEYKHTAFKVLGLDYPDMVA